MSQPHRLRGVGVIDRSTPIEFRFNGRALSGYAGDTLASALLANDVTKHASMMMNKTFHLNERRPISTFFPDFTVDYSLTDQTRKSDHNPDTYHTSGACLDTKVQIRTPP